MTAIRFPTGFTIEDLLDSGITGIVYLDSASNTVIKCPHREEVQPEIDVERRIYERFQQHGGHAGLLQYHGTFESGIRLEYASKDGIRDYMQTHEVDIKQRLQWSQQITSALSFVHSMGVIHGDLTCGNIALDDSLHAKLFDFGGSSLDGSEPLVAVTASHRCPGVDFKSTRVDLFALGSTLYEIWTGKPPYQELEHAENEITKLFERSEFPETKSLGPIGDVITGCWQGRFASVDDVFEGKWIVNLINGYLLTLRSHKSL